MTWEQFRRLGFSNSLSCSMAGLAYVSLGLSVLSSAAGCFGQSQIENSVTFEPLLFDVASIKVVGSLSERRGHDATNSVAAMPVMGSITRIAFEPGRFVASNCTVELLLETAYGVDDRQITGLPDWANSA